MTPSVEPRKPYPRGTYSKVARKLGVTPQSVRLVAMGVATSARISSALRKERRLADQREARRAASSEAGSRTSAA